MGLGPGSGVCVSPERPHIRRPLLQLGWRDSPCWGGLVASAMHEAYRVATCASLVTSAATEEATSHMGVARPPEKIVKSLPLGIPGVKGARRRKSDPAWVMFFVDDAISVEI